MGVEDEEVDKVVQGSADRGSSGSSSGSASAEHVGDSPMDIVTE